MRLRPALWVLASVALALASCSEDRAAEPPSRERVEKALRQEAGNMKREGESDVNPALGVTVSWEVQSVEVHPQAGNETEPWAGTIKFLIESRTPELDGTATERFEKSYEYVWDMERQSWIMQ